MKILFLNPPFKDGRFSRASRSPAITKSGTLYYPIWLAYAAGLLEKESFEVKLVDAPAAGLSKNDSLKIAVGFNPDLVVIDTSTPSIYSDIEMGALIKDAVKDAFIILVGTHPSALPGETLDLSRAIDAVAIGEYDYTIRDLARILNNGKDLKSIAGISYRDGDSIIHNGRRPLVEDLDGLPFVSSVYKRHLDVRDYFFAASYYPFVMILTGRGCPFGCSFCLYPQVFHSRKCRFRSPDNVADEFEYIKTELPHVKEIGIEDDTFTVDKERTMRICEALIRRKVRIPWYAAARADLDFETMVIMKKAGCRLLIVGYESGSQEILDNIHKGIKLEAMARFNEDAKKAGLLVHGCFIVGGPGERSDTVFETINFAKGLQCDTVQFFPLMVYPGTEAYEWAMEKGYVKAEDFSDWATDEGLHNTVLNTDNLSGEDLIHFCNYARRQFYLRPSYISRKALQCLRNPDEFIRTFKSLRIFYKYLL